MILYRLRCADDHEFEGWFRNAAAFEDQRDGGDLSCPVCGSDSVDKALMAPRIAKSAEPRQKPPAPAENAGKQAMTADVPQMAAMKAKLRSLRRAIEANCEYVGPRFAEEARRIHNGESEAQGIYGETSPDEADRLKDEGIEFASIPWLRDDA